MPYITPERRQKLAHLPLNETGPGDLAYALTMMIHEYLKAHKHNFETLNSIVGVLDNVKDEFKRQILNKYEDQKKFDNGAVSELDE